MMKRTGINAKDCVDKECKVWSPNKDNKHTSFNFYTLHLIVYNQVSGVIILSLFIFLFYQILKIRS